MPRAHKPRSGSLQFWPRVRTKRAYARIRAWQNSRELKPLGFAGYKVGMTHILIKDNRPNSPTQGDEVSIPVTILECPPLKILGIRLYKYENDSFYPLLDIFSKKFDKKLSRKISLPKMTQENQDKNIHNYINQIKDVRLLVYSQPKLTTIGKKKPEIFEIALGNQDINKKLEFANSLLDKEIKVSDIFKEGQFVDVHAVTTGKGLQGPIKRFGISLKSHKSEKKKRSAGNLGAWTPKKVSWTVPQKGQMGYQLRTDYNKHLVLIGKDNTKINKKSGFNRYGVIKNDFVLIKGSVPGPTKRLIRFNETIRNIHKKIPLTITYISQK